MLYLFTPTKSYVYLLNVEPSNLVFLKTYNREFDEIMLKDLDFYHLLEHIKNNY